MGFPIISLLAPVVSRTAIAGSIMALAAVPPGLLAAASDETDGPLEAELLSEIVQAGPGGSFRAGVRVDPEEGWRVFGEDPGMAGLPLEIDWVLPEGVEAGPLEFPEAEFFTAFGDDTEGYGDGFLVWSEIRTDAGIESPLTLTARLSWMAIDGEENIESGETELALEIPVGDTMIPSETLAPLFGRESVDEIVAETETPDVEDGERPGFFGGLLFYLFAGFVGGLILNIMPCVLPVIGIKILSVVKQSGDQPSVIRKKGWAFTAGAVVCFWVLALIVVLLQGAGTLVGHGFQFQSFPFLIFITSLVFVLALSMLGVFSIELIQGGYRGAQALTDRGGYTGAFFNGALATILATPCTAPLLGVALGFAFTQPPWVTFLVFTFIGLGLAFPFTLLAYKPEWLRFLPKPGMWMERFKQAMGFLMLAVVVWLLWVIRYHGADAVVWTVAFLFALGLVCWIYGAFSGAARTSGGRWVMRFSILGILVASWIGILENQLNWRGPPAPAGESVAAGGEETGSADRIAWRSFNSESLEEALATDRPVFVNFTAAWCVSCIANERSSLEIPRTRRIIEETGTIAIKADWTHQDDEITNKLREFDRAGIPFYLVYGADRDNPRILPELLTPQIVGNALEQAAASFEDTGE